MASKRKADGIKREEGIWEQLMRLRAATEEMGILHEGQANQLKIWGPLALPHAHDIEIRVGLPHLDKADRLVDMNRIEYHAKSDDRPPKDLRNRLGGLHRSVTAMLGAHFTLTVKINSVAIFHREGKARKKRSLAKLMSRLKDGTKKEML